MEWEGGGGRTAARFVLAAVHAFSSSSAFSIHTSSYHVLPTISPRSPLHTSFTIYSYPFRYDMVHSQHFGDAIRNTVVWRYLVLDEGHKV